MISFKLKNVLQTQMLSTIGNNLTNSSGCEIMQSCFQICFEARLGGKCVSSLSLSDIIKLNLFN